MSTSPSDSSRNMAIMAGNTRSRDYSNGVPLNSNNGNDPELSRASAWGKNIWNAPIGTFPPGSKARDNSRPQENGAAIGTPASLVEGKTGSGSLLTNSETEWTSAARPVWGETASGSIPHARSSGVSPARKRSVAQAQPVQQYSDPSAFFPSARGSLAGQGSQANPVKPFLDPTTSNFTSRQIDSLSTGFTNFGFGQTDANSQRPDTGVTSWPDTGSVHSANDDRRSVANSEYFASSSGAPSQNGSLPPSRHGAEPAQLGQAADMFSRFNQPSRHASSFSMASSRVFNERSGSIHSESFHSFGRLNNDQDQDARMAANRSFSINPFTPAQAPGQDVNDAPTGSYTPDGYPSTHLGNQYSQLRSHQPESSRSAPNGTGVRQSPFSSYMSTPPVYDRLNPYSSEQMLAHPNSVTQLQNKLAGFQMAQQHNYISPSQLHQQQYLNIFPVAQLQNPYQFLYSLPNGMPLPAIPQHMHTASSSPMMPVSQCSSPPRGPREAQVGDGLGAMSPLLANFKREQKQSRRLELSEIKGHVVEFAGDQHGSRFIQQKLESANSEVKESVFRELEENALQLMQDVFGNYVIQKFFEHGDQIQKKILVGKMKGHVLELASQMYACRVVQKALEHALTEQQAEMVKELERDVLKTVRDQNGNHVIQKVIDRVPMQYIHRVVEAFRGNVGTLSVNSYGCRVIQRLLEKVPEPQRRFILTELHIEIPKLITDQYGNYVTQHVIEHGLHEDRAKIVAIIKAQFLMFSKHKFASNVVEHCLQYSDDAQRRELIAVMLAKNERGDSNVMTLLKDGYGNYVIQKMLDTLNRDDYEKFVQALRPELEKAKKVIPGKQCVSVEKKMFRYDRVDSPTMLTPALSSSAQSPQSSSHPSTNNSTIDEPVHRAPINGKHNTVNVAGGVSIEDTA